MDFKSRLKSIIDSSAREPLWKFLLLTGLICAILLGISFNAQPTVIDDNYHYMNLGRALYEGKGFVRLDTPGHPPEDIVTPGYPLILAGIMKIMGDPKPLVALKLFSTLCYLLTILISVMVFVKIMKLPRWSAFVFAVYMSMTGYVARYSSLVLTEAPFMLFVALTVYFVLLYERDRKDLFFYLATLTTVLGIYIRLPGAPLAVALFAWLLIRKDYKKALIFGTIVGVTVGAWVVPKILADQFRYGGQFVVRESTNLEAARTKSHLSRYFYNLGHYLFISFPRLVFPRLASFSQGKKILFFYSGLELLIGLPVLALLVFGVISGLRNRKLGFPFFLFATYFLLISFFASTGIRYSVYVFPWFILSLFFGIKFVLDKIFDKWLSKRLLFLRTIILSLLSIALIILTVPSYSGGVFHTSVTRKIARMGHKPPNALVVGADHPNVVPIHRLYDACDWVRTELPEDAVLISAQYRSVYYYSERPCLSPLYWEELLKLYGYDRERELRETEIDSMWSWALDNGVTHLVLDPIYGVTLKYLKPALARYQECFTEVYKTKEPITRVYEIDTTCLRQFILHNDKALFDRLLREVSRLSEVGEEDSLASLLANHDTSNAEVVGICRFLSYYIHLNEYDDLHRLFEVAQIIYPDNPVLWLNWGIEHNRLGMVDISVPAFEKALAFGADSGDCYNNLGVALSVKKDLVGARGFFAKALSHSPDDPTILKNRVSNLISLREVDRADSILTWASGRSDVSEEYHKQVESLNKSFEKWKRGKGL